MDFNSISFLAAYATSKSLPESQLPEICFAGRSNVGKSSLINRVAGKKAMARTGSKPGKTVTVNFYNAENLRLVDLPGYGYAKISLAEKERFAELMEGYFTSSRNIKHCFCLVDIRRGLMPQDEDMINMLISFSVPFTVVLTKCDKLNKTETSAALSKVKDCLLENGINTDIVLFSSLTATGVEKVREIIEKNC